jgi:uncharacterized Ntn-hydrolase superfamily protein
MTFSVGGRCAATGQTGVAISSSSPAVAARCAWVRGGVGAATTQNVTDPRLGPALLDALASGLLASQAVDAVVESQPPELAAWRQLTAVDSSGGTAAFTGSRALGVHAQVVRPGVVVAGNLLSAPQVLTTAADAFDANDDLPLGERLLLALQAALDAGGEAGPVHSAGLLVAAPDPVRSWPVTDLRVDHDDEPVRRLLDLWRLWAPQAEAYVARALAPDESPGYGVAGDDR